MNKLNTFLEKQEWKRLFGFFLIAWITINFLQVIFTEVMNDETYYYLYGENPAWGYYDHPPMVGFMTYISSLLFNGNMSVRFMTVIFQFFTLVFIWKIIGEEKPDSRKTVLFFIISASMIMFTAYGFVTAPDVPFLFFTAFFLFIYKKYLRHDSWTNTLLLGFAMAGMVYSKYHAALIILLIVLSNLRLLTKYKSWVALLFAVVLLAPHIGWQVSNDFPSFQYHLSGRSSVFKWRYFTEYIPNQLIVFNPVTWIAFVYVLIKYKPVDVFERGLYFLSIGFFAFFWLMTFRGHVEPHWTVACTIPMILLVYKYSLLNEKFYRFVMNWVTPTIILIFIVRIVLTTDLLPEKLGFHEKEARDKKIEEAAGNLPVVSTGSFQHPSTYHFFTGKESFVLSGVNSRQTQFDIWQKELEYQGKSVFICSHIENKSTTYTVDGYSFSGYVTHNFQSVNRLKINYELPKTDLKSGDEMYVDFTIKNPTEYDVNFNHEEFPVTLRAAYAKRKSADYSECTLDKEIKSLAAHGEISGRLKTIVPDLTDEKYSFTLTLDNTICPAVNASYTPVKIKR